MTEEFSVLESEQRKVFYRGFFKGDEIEKPEELQTLLKNISVYDLLQAFKMAVNKAEEEYVHEIKKINVTVEEQMNFILDKIKKDKKISFVNLVTGLKEKIRIIVTFIAMLELVKLREIDLRESESFNDFEIYGLENG